MTKKAKIAWGLVAIFFTLTSLLTTVIIIAPRFIDHDLVRNKVRNEMSQLMGGEVDYQQVNLSFFPIPKVLLSNFKIIIPGKISASAETIDLYPEMLSLLSGNITFKKAAFIRPEVTIQIPESLSKKSSKPFEMNQVIQVVTSTLKKLAQSDLPVAQCIMNMGSLTLMYDKNTRFSLQKIQVDFQTKSNQSTFSLTAGSNIFERISISGSMDGQKKESRAKIALKKIQSETIYNTFLPEAPLKVTAGDTDLTIDLSMDFSRINQESGKAVIHLVSPDIHLEYSGQTANVNIRKLSGSFGFNNDSATLSLTELLMGNPLMRLSGDFIISEQEPKFVLKFAGTNLDISSTRSMVLSMTRDNTAVRTVFDILKKGNIPLIKVSGQANRLTEFGNIERLEILGQIRDANIKIPGTDLELDAASGDVKISQGILTGENIQARWGNSSFQEGRLKLDLTQEVMSIDAQTQILADMADIPAIMTRIVKDGDFKNELAQIQNIQGSGKVKLNLTGDMDQLKVSVFARDLAVAGHYQKIPYPLSITNGSLTYDENAIGWEHLDGLIGTSTFADFAGSLDLGKTKMLKVSAGACHILVPELLPWISSHEKQKKVSDYFDEGKGILQLSKVSLEGPLNSPLENFRQWTFDIAGQVEDFTIQNLPAQPGPLNIAFLKFTATPQTLEYTDAKVSILDASMSLSGIHQQYMEKLNSDASWTFMGQIGPKITDWFSQYADLPDWLKLRPLSFGPSQIDYSNQGKKTLKATLDFQDEIALFADISFSPDEVIFKKLTIQDQTALATLAGSYISGSDLARSNLTDSRKKKSLDLSFDGILHESTLGRLFHTSSPLNGLITGSTRTHLNLIPPYKVRFEGEFKAENLDIPLSPPLSIHKIAVKGEADAITIESADLFWNDTDFQLSGKITPGTSESLLLDLDITADMINLEKIVAHLDALDKSPNKKKTPPSLPIQLTGDIRLKAHKVRTKALTIQPLHADIKILDNMADITLKDTKLCGISTPGTIKVSHHSLEFILKPGAQDQPLNKTLDCLLNKAEKIDGTFNVKGVIKGNDRIENLLKSSTGQIDIDISDGHFYQNIILLNVIRFLNARKVLTNSLTADKMTKQGMGFKHFQARVSLQDGKMQYEKFLLDADDLTMIGTGEIDLIDQQVDLILLVAPQKTITNILGYIPLVGGVMQTITTIPISIKGHIDDIRVMPLSASAVKYELTKIMEETLHAPMKLISIKNFKNE